MGHAISRAQFLRGDFRGKHQEVRPPWSRSESRFTSACDRCGKCIAACETGVLAKGSGGYPMVDFRKGECTFCGRCVEACSAEAFRPGAPDGAPWNLTARIGEACLSHKGIECRACGDYCEPRALRFRLAVGGIAKPEFDAGSCNGCGACVAPCPTGAITVRKPAEENPS